MRHLSKDNWKREETSLKLEEIRLIGELFSRLVVVGIENCQDHQVEELSRDLDISVEGQCLPEERLAYDAMTDRM